MSAGLWDEVNARYTAPDDDGIEAAGGAKAATSYSAAKVATKLSEEEAAAAEDAAAAAAASAKGVTIAAFAAGLHAAGGSTSPEVCSRRNIPPRHRHGCLTLV
jgi:cytochrome c5